MDEPAAIKQKLYVNCTEQIETKLGEISGALNELQDSANRETKSSMGDKYETGRAAIQLEMEKYAHQLNELAEMKKILFRINAKKNYDTVQPGCVVLTNNGNFFIAVNAGDFKIEDTKYLTISLASPLGKELHKRRKGERFNFRNRDFEILEVF